MRKSACTVLVAEDGALIRLDIVEALEEAASMVLEASNVAEAVAILGMVADIEAVFTEIDMPGPHDGLYLPNSIHSKWPPIRILIASGGRRVTLSDLLDQSRFLPKPYDSLNVIANINEMLRTG